MDYDQLIQNARIGTPWPGATVVLQQMAAAIETLRKERDAFRALLDEAVEAIRPFAIIEAVMEDTDLGTLYEWSMDCDSIRNAQAFLTKIESSRS